MPEGEHESRPRWAEQERLLDLAWLGQELPVLWAVAQAGYEAVGRGAVVVDTSQEIEELGHPLAYFTQDALAAFGDLDAMRMVTAYQPNWELVAILLKLLERLSRAPMAFWLTPCWWRATTSS
jgi:hypothetical protein